MQRQREEEEEKRQKDAEAATPAEEDASFDLETATEDVISNFSNEVRNIMNGVQEMETNDTGMDDDDDIRSPVKKRQGSSKTSSRRNANARQVSPNKEGPVVLPSAQTTTFLDNFVYPHSRIILELAVILKSDKASEEFTQALMAFLANAQMVDPKFVINPLDPNSKEKNISSKGEILTNLTKLGAHVKISGNGNVFSKQKVWNKEESSDRGTRKSNKKEEFKDPTIYFSMIVSSEVAPKDLIERTTHEWARMNGMRLQVKELQFVKSKTVVTFYKVSKLTPKNVLLAELKKILLMAQDRAREDALEEDLYNFSMDIDVAIGETLPEMTLRVVQAKLKGEFVSTFNKLNNRAQFACKTWHLEVASKYATKMKGLVQRAKEYGCFGHYWGVHAHISEVTDITSTASEAKRQVETAQKHVNYKLSMTAEELVGVIDLDHLTEIRHPTSRKVVARYSL
jgi:hypothetical protein